MQTQQYPLEKQHWEMNSTERAEATFIKEIEELQQKLNDNQGKPLTPQEKDKISADLNLRLEQIATIGWVESEIDKLKNFRNKGTSIMDQRKRRWENHSSTRLGENLSRIGKVRPDQNCQAHAIIAGTDPKAGRMRAMLALIGRRVDDPSNGVWLPNYEKNHPHWAMPNAVCHAWLNHDGYHDWIHTDMFTSNLVSAPKITDHNLVISQLQKIAILLQKYGDNVPDKAIKKKKKVEA